MKAISIIRSHISINRIGISFPLKHTCCGRNFADSNIHWLSSFSTKTVPPTLREQGDVDNSQSTVENKSVTQLVLPAHLTISSKKLKSISQVCMSGPAKLCPHFVYLIELGLDLEQLKEMTRKFPPLANYSLDGKIKPVIQFLFDIGVSRSSIPNMLHKWPRLCGLNITDNALKFLENLGVDKKQQAKMIYRCPALLGYSTQKLKANVSFLFEMGISSDNMVRIVTSCPSILGCSVEDNLRPATEYFRSLGADVALLIYRCPTLLTCSKKKVKKYVDFLYDMGISPERIGKIITMCPSILNLSLEDTLQPRAEYFRSLGVDVAALVNKYPQSLSLSIDANLKPVTNFFLEKGFSIEEIGTMVSKFKPLYCLSLERNIIPKWEFFLTTDYLPSELVKFPVYFGYSLECRIKPRYALLKDCGGKLPLNMLLAYTSHNLDMSLNRKMKKMPVIKRSECLS